MKIYSIHDPEFIPYGKVLEGCDAICLLNAMKTIPPAIFPMTFEEESVC